MAIVSTIDDSAADADAIHQCVQCGADFAEKDNVSGSCNYHPAISYVYHSWSCELPCCGQSQTSYTPFPSSGCTKGSHAKAHHDRYPYINRLGHYRTLLQGADTWILVQQEDVTVAKADGADIGSTLAGHIGILRDEETVVAWATQGNVTIDLKVILLQRCQDDDLVVLEATNRTTLLNDAWNKAVTADGLSWSIKVTTAPTRASNGTIFRLSVQTPTSPTPNIKVLHVFGDTVDAPRLTETVFDTTRNFADLYDVAASSWPLPPAIRSYRPIPPELFDTVKVLPTFQSSGDLPLRVKLMKPVEANGDSRPFRHDMFVAHFLFVDTSALPPPSSGQVTTMPSSTTTSTSALSLLADERNLILTMVRDHTISVDDAERLLTATATHASSAAAAAALASSAPSNSIVAYTLVEVGAQLSLDRGQTWIRADAVQLNGQSNDVVTYQIPQGGVDKVQVAARFPAPTKQGQWGNRAYLTRLLVHPAILRYTFENAIGQVTSVDVAFQNAPLSPLPSRDPATDWFFLSLDHVDDLSRSYAKVTRCPPTDPSTNDPLTLFVVEHCYNGGTTSSYAITGRSVRLWRSQLGRVRRLHGQTQSDAVEKLPSQLPLRDMSEMGRVEWTAVFDSTGSTLVALRAKLVHKTDVAEDAWVLDWPALSKALAT
ncbi:hypothetical protein H310_05198 [Aphanomyces invadans]|uniref:Uncharacterized protein n=1 Tax=Aphanomyces invadans TaxID=157072 RepID=A0A024UD91_9STRA|nr:hypothetical protein H310_05198 [Aphanomyces invadans]ETW03842.1 hypothetical protein H310_05198 [Aphanomyces invadans]|eukprot:XP_008868071.1 hypothetical protein H310_05198 [Aphanomyces invadans]